MSCDGNSNRSDDVWNRSRNELWAKTPFHPHAALTWLLPPQHVYLFSFLASKQFLLITVICHSISLFYRGDCWLWKSNYIRYLENIRAISSLVNSKAFLLTTIDAHVNVVTRILQVQLPSRIKRTGTPLYTCNEVWFYF